MSERPNVSHVVHETHSVPQYYFILRILFSNMKHLYGSHIDTTVHARLKGYCITTSCMHKNVVVKNLRIVGNSHVSPSEVIYYIA